MGVFYFLQLPHSLVRLIPFIAKHGIITIHKRNRAIEMTITQIERQITNLEIEDHIANSDQIDHLKKMKGQLVMVRLAKSLKRK